MKLLMTFKCPDAFCVNQKTGKQYDGIDALPDNVQKAVGEFVEYMEYINVEFDTVAGTARVVKP